MDHQPMDLGHDTPLITPPQGTGFKGKTPYGP